MAAGEMRFRDRAHAGRVLAGMLASYRHRPGLQVLALPRGGVPVAFEIARDLRAPLDVFLVRKLGVPGQPELAMGAIASGGVRVLNREVLDAFRIEDQAVDTITAAEQRELARRELEYRGGRQAPEVHGRTVLLVDDGLATGSSMRAAVEALRGLDPAWIVVAVPVGAPPVCAELRSLVDDAVCAMTPEDFSAVGNWYEDFAPVSDSEVRGLLERAAHGRPRRQG